MDRQPKEGFRFMTILAISLIVVLIGYILNLPIPVLLLVAVGCYILGDILIQIPSATSPRRRQV
ncbi:hypothetical protein J2T58_002038 [Methanocalculus alkaliphilus]|uniref:hypothetical protein n=1 Tax=Methanocalculus alkaliphilus TaxID=768730 RepID=UPI00209F6A19|nr:hypothetical protein [Methanocalculus alkaliphilus]MCP1716163.1 hypothetical protein [Methanocalculus alkaliphilus]